MKFLRYVVLSALALSVSTALNAADFQNNYQNNSNAPVKIRVVNFKTCVEKSKLGKQEQSTFDALKKQMESNLEEREKTLNDLAKKFEDPDYLDSLSAEAETEMKRNFRKLSQEYSTLQNQYLQALQQTNFKVVQKLTASVEKASAAVAKQNNYDLVLNQEGSFFVNPQLDASMQVVAAMDDMFEKEKDSPSATTALNDQMR
jgi:outer membrane protein